MVQAVRRLFLILSVMVAVVPRVAAQSGQPSAKDMFDGYVTSEPYRRYLETVFNRGEPQPPKAQCKTMKVVTSDRYLVLDPPKFTQVGGSYQIDSGTWVAVAALDRCGKRVTRRAVLKAVPGTNGLDVTLLLPGDFRGNLKVEADAQQIVVPSLMASAKCQDATTFSVLDIKLLGAATAQGWSETWTAQACGTPVSAKVVYSKTSTGVNIVASDVKAK